MKRQVLSNFIKSIVNKKIYFFSSCMFFIICLVFFLDYQQLPNKPYFDAKNYLALAHRIDDFGLFNFESPLRTFAYPFILSIFLKLVNLFNLSIDYFLFLFQSLFYYFTILSLRKSISYHSIKLSNIIFTILCFNIFLIPYFPISLTDSIYVTCFLLIINFIIKVNLHLNKSLLISLFFLIFLTNLSITIRPIAIWFCIPTVFFITSTLLNEKINLKHFFIVLFLGCFPLFIQLIINHLNHQIISIFPAIDLGSLQIKWGIENLKYGTWVGKGNNSNHYLSKYLIEIGTDKLDIWWYFKNIEEAIKLIFYKIIGAFDYDFLTPYPNKIPHYKWAASFVSYSILWFGFFGCIYHLIYKNLYILGSRYLPIIIILSWFVFNIISALELRFTLPILSYFLIVIGCLFFEFITKPNKKILFYLITGWLLLMPIFFIVASNIRFQSILTLH